MNAKHLLLAIFCFGIATIETSAQLGFSHEIGVIAGPVAFQSDYGERLDFETNSGNVGFGVGIVHYLNFAYRADCNCYSRDTYWNDHFKIRNEIDYHETNLDNFGEEARDNDFGGLRLRNHKGKARVFEIGTQLEYFPMSIRDFQAGAYKLAPYVSLGVHYVSFNPEATTLLRSDGDIFGVVENPFTADPTDVGPALIEGFGVGEGRNGTGIDDRPGDTWAITWSAGVRYKLGPLSDLLIDARWHFYTSNWVDGLNPDPRPSNRANDWIFWLNVGYVYYIE